MVVVILCGGKGARAFPFSEYLPKPMMPVAGSPILVQVIRLYASQGFDRFVLAAGHRKNALDDYFHGKEMGVDVEVVDTGESADTGERILACRDRVGETFMVTYGDGLANVDLRALAAFHAGHGAPATMTCAPLYSQYGIVEFGSDGRIDRMREKPRMREHWMNVGFFVFQRSVFDHWEGTNLERDVLPALVQRGLAYAFRHDGFFKSLDSYKDQGEFEALVADGSVPWMTRSAASDEMAGE